MASEETFPIVVKVRPVTCQGETITEICIREPKARDYFAVIGKKPDVFAETQALLVSLTERTIEELGELDPRDYFELVEVVRPFSLARRFQAASETPSPISPVHSAGAGPNSSISTSPN